MVQHEVLCSFFTVPCPHHHPLFPSLATDAELWGVPVSEVSGSIHRSLEVSEVIRDTLHFAPSLVVGPGLVVLFRVLL